MYAFERYGVECGDGWKHIIQPLFDYINEYNSSHSGQIVIAQVKEKFGSLRFYVDFEDVPKEVSEELHAMIRKAEEESSITCDVCGTKENVGYTVDGWIWTVCENCLKERLQNPNYWYKERRWKRFSNNQILTFKRNEQPESNV